MFCSYLKLLRDFWVSLYFFVLKLWGLWVEFGLDLIINHYLCLTGVA